MNFCKNCSSRMDDGAVVCPVCKTNIHTGETDRKTESSGFIPSTDTFDTLGAKSLYAPTSHTNTSYKPSNGAETFGKASPSGGTAFYGAHSPSVSAMYPPSGPKSPVSRPPAPKPSKMSSPPAYIPTAIPPKSAIESMSVQEEFVKSTCRYTNIILSVLIAITLIVSGCFVYVRFYSSTEESDYSSTARKLVATYVDSLNECDTDSFMDVTIFSALSDEDIEKTYKSTYMQIKDETETAFSQMKGSTISVDGIVVTDMSDDQIEKLNAEAPGDIKIQNALNIECVMHLENEDGSYSRKRNLQAVYTDGEWYLYRL